MCEILLEKSRFLRVLKVKSSFCSNRSRCFYEIKKKSQHDTIIGTCQNNEQVCET